MNARVDGRFCILTREKVDRPRVYRGLHRAAPDNATNMNTEIMNSEQKAGHLTPALSPERRGSEIGEAPCVTRFELANLLQVSVRTVDRMIAAGEIPVRRVRGKAVRFLRSDVEQYLTREKLKS